MNAPGDRMYVGQPGGEIWTIDPTTGRRTEPTMHTDGGDPVLISTSPDGSRVLVTSWNMEYTPGSMLFDAETGEQIRAGLVGIGLTTLTARGEIAGTVGTNPSSATTRTRSSGSARFLAPPAASTP